MDLLKRLFKGDRIVWIIFMLLCFISIIEVFSASSSLTFQSGDHWKPITSHIVLIMAGTIIVFFTHIMPCRWFKKLKILLPISWGLLFTVFITGAITNGAKRWIDLGLFQFQPSEVAKMALIISVASTLAKSQTEEGADKSAFKYIMWITVLTVGFIFTENLSTAVLLSGTIFIMMFIGRVPIKQLGKLAAFCFLMLVIFISAIKFIPNSAFEAVGMHRYTTWKNRLDTHFNQGQIPAAKFDIDNDAQVAHANIAIATSNILGKGPGNSVQRDFLSQAYSDFIYAIIIEELGLVGGGFVAMLYIILLLRIGKIARECDDVFYTLLIMGIGVLISLQAMFNMLVAVSIIPVTGQPLPLISKGGTSLLINSVYIGIILSISRHVNEIKAKKAEEEAMMQEQLKGEAVTILQDAALRLAEKNFSEKKGDL